MHRREEADTRGMTKTDSTWEGDDEYSMSTFVAGVLLLSRAWGMSCYAAKHYTQQPSLYLQFLSLSHPFPLCLPYIKYVSMCAK